MKDTIKLPDPYKHNPKLEKRPYYRVDRFLSDLSGVVHYYTFPTNVPFRSIFQLEEQYTPTKDDFEREQARIKEANEFRNRARSNLEQITAQLKTAPAMPAPKRNTLPAPKPNRLEANPHPHSNPTNIKRGASRPAPRKAKRADQ